MKLEDYSKYYIQGSDHYLIPKDDLAELVEENQELKQQLDKYENEPLTNKISRIDSVVSNIYSQNKTQQKEFIKYLVNLSNGYSKDGDGIKETIVNIILRNYKSIIGDDK